MAEDMKQNQDYQLVMKFLQLIKPGDMDEDSANQLMMIGQRIQNGGILSDKEREMFRSVVGAMPMEGEMQMSYEVDGRMEAMTPSQMQAARDSGEITPMGAMTDAQKRMMQEEAFQRMIMEQNEMQQRAMDQRMMDDINAGSAAPMTSPRPMARPMRQEAIMAEVNVENMEENADLFMEKMGFPHDADGLEMTDEQLVNFLMLCYQEKYGMHDEEYEEDCDCDHGDEDCDCGHHEMMMPDDGIKVKVMRVGDGGSVHEMMNEILGGY